MRRLRPVIHVLLQDFPGSKQNYKNPCNYLYLPHLGCPCKGSAGGGWESRYTWPMRFFVKAIASGFAMSLGSAIFKKVSKKIGLDDEKTEEEKAEEEKAQAEENEGEVDGEVGDAP